MFSRLPFVALLLTGLPGVFLFPLLGEMASPQNETPVPALGRTWELKEEGKIQGYLVEAVDDSASIQRSEDGTIVSLPVDSLSDRDQRHLEEVLVAAFHLMHRQAQEQFYDIFFFGKITSITSDHWDSSVEIGGQIEAWLRIDTSVPASILDIDGSPPTLAIFQLSSENTMYQIRFGNYVRRGKSGQFAIYKENKDFGDGYQIDGYHHHIEFDNTGLDRGGMAVRLWSKDRIVANISHPVEEIPVRKFNGSASISAGGYRTDTDDYATVIGSVEAYSVRHQPGPTFIGSAREWRDPEGRSFQGQLLRIEDGAVVIQRSADSKEFAVPISRLSLEDRNFLSEIQDAARRKIGRLPGGTEKMPE